MAARKNGKKMPAKVVEDEDYQLQYQVAAGIDVGKDTTWVCVRLPPEEGRKRRASRVWASGSAVPAVRAVAAELAAAGVEMVSMESTSDYWRVWFAVLEDAGLRVQLVNSSQAKNLPGRPKSDKADAQWIARLTEMGMLRPSLVLPPEIRALQVLTRDRADLTRDRTRWWQRLEKLLEDALCKMPAVVSTLADGESARAMIDAMIGGERDPHVLAGMAQTRMVVKIPELVEAFTGMRFGDHHAEQAAMYLRMTDRLKAEIRDLDDRIAARIARIPASWGTDADGVTGPDAGHGPDAAVLPAVQRLDEIPGISAEMAVSLIAEIGLDMSRFPTADCLVSWAGLAPVPNQSGKRKGKDKKGHGDTYAKRIAFIAANAAAGTDTFLGARHRRLASRPGGGGRKKASCAVARSVLIIVWHLLNDPAARYVDLGPDHYAKHADASRKTRSHVRQLQALGYDVALTPREDAA
jgi:transposase